MTRALIGTRDRVEDEISAPQERRGRPRCLKHVARHDRCSFRVSRKRRQRFKALGAVPAKLDPALTPETETRTGAIGPFADLTDSALGVNEERPAAVPSLRSPLPLPPPRFPPDFPGGGKRGRRDPKIRRIREERAGIISTQTWNFSAQSRARSRGASKSGRHPVRGFRRLQVRIPPFEERRSRSRCHREVARC